MYLLIPLLFITSVMLTLIVRTFARKHALVDIPNDRSSHVVATPHGGGIAIAVTWSIGISVLYFMNILEERLFFALLPGLLLAMVSFIDDIVEIAPKIRLAVQGLVAFLGIYLLGGIDSLDVGFFTLTNSYIINGLTFIGIIWMINLYNFLDGIDGYAASEAIFLSLAGYILFQHPLFLVLSVSVAGFLVFNWHKASIFMGDVGSTLLGYSFAIIALSYQNEGTSILVWLILLGLFWFDATFSLYRRFRNHEKLSVAHRKHAFQRMVQAGYSHSQVTLMGVGVNLLLLVSALLGFYYPQWLGICFIGVALLLYFSVRLVDKKKRFE